MIFIILVQPLYVAEVLTMWQLIALREHTYCSFERTSINRLNLCLKCIVITLMTNNLEWEYRINLLTILRLIGKNNKFQTNSIIQALLVYNILNLVLLTSLSTISCLIIL